MSIPRAVLAKYVIPGCFFIETGTRWGDTTIEAMRLGASEAWTFENDRIFAALAEQHIEDALKGQASSVQVHHEDSAEGLAFDLEPDGADIILFLDAHSDTETPVLRELSVIRDHWTQIRPAVILIDDMRLFRSRHWGVGVEELVAAISQLGRYDISSDNGIEPEDILVARRKS